MGALSVIKGSATASSPSDATAGANDDTGYMDTPAYGDDACVLLSTNPKSIDVQLTYTLALLSVCFTRLVLVRLRCAALTVTTTPLPTSRYGGDTGGYMDVNAGEEDMDDV